MNPRFSRIRPGGWLLSLAAILATIAGRGAAAADWTDHREVGPFVCRADFPLQGMEGLLADLDELQGDLSESLGIPPAQERIEIYLFGDESSYHRYLKTYFPQLPYRRALFAKLGGPGMVFAYRGKEFETGLRHECTHALLHAALPSVPLWLDEGLAEYFQEPRAKRAYDSRHLSDDPLVGPLGHGPQSGGSGEEDRPFADDFHGLPLRLGLGPLHAPRFGGGARGVGEIPGRHPGGRPLRPAEPTPGPATGGRGPEFLHPFQGLEPLNLVVSG